MSGGASCWLENKVSWSIGICCLQVLLVLVRSADLLPECRCRHNERTKFFLLALVFIFLIGDNHCGKSGVATTIAV
jgi:hypothetical protein